MSSLIFRLASLAMLAIFSPLHAGQLTVAPIRLHMSPTQPNDTFSLVNGADEEGFYQLQLFAWEQVDGKSQFRKQQDLVVTPPVTLIPGNSEQIVRVVRQRPTDSDSELSYRLIISEVPNPETESGAQLKVLLRLSVPIFVGEEGQRHELAVTRQDNHLLIRNSGNAHARLSDLFWENQDGSKEMIKRGLAGYVLPGGELRVDLQGRTESLQESLGLTLNGKPTRLPVE